MVKYELSETDEAKVHWQAFLVTGTNIYVA
jgi:hypothetical protein